MHVHVHLLYAGHTLCMLKNHSIGGGRFIGEGYVCGRMVDIALLLVLFVYIPLDEHRKKYHIPSPGFTLDFVRQSPG